MFVKKTKQCGLIFETSRAIFSQAQWRDLYQSALFGRIRATSELPGRSERDETTDVHECERDNRASSYVTPSHDLPFALNYCDFCILLKYYEFLTQIAEKHISTAPMVLSGPLLHYLHFRHFSTFHAFSDFPVALFSAKPNETSFSGWKLI